MTEFYDEGLHKHKFAEFEIAEAMEKSSIVVAAMTYFSDQETITKDLGQENVNTILEAVKFLNATEPESIDYIQNAIEKKMGDGTFYVTPQLLNNAINYSKKLLAKRN